MDKKDILQAIHNKNLDIFETENIDNFLNFSDEFGNNIFHLLAKNSGKDFVKLASLTLLNRDEKIKDLLLERNKNNELPAYFHSGEQKNTDFLSDQDKTRHESYKVLKRLTKQIYYEKNTGTPYDKGEAFEDGIPLKTVEMQTPTGFTTSVPSFMTIRLIKNEHDENRKPKLSLDENDTSFINFSKSVSISKNETKENIGEFIELKNVPLTGTPLSLTVKEMLPFPEDYSFAMQALDAFDEQVKQGFNKEETSELIQNFFLNGGVLHIKDQNEKNHLTTSLKQDGKDASVGSFSRKKAPSGEMVPFVSLLASEDFNKSNIKETFIHELTHSADLNFSKTPVFGYFLTLQAGRIDTPPNIKEKLNGIARSYKPDSFNREALAYLNSLSIKDPLTEEFFKLFNNYTKALNQKNLTALETISKSCSNIENVRTIISFASIFNKHVETEKNIDFANISNTLMVTSLIPTFTKELKKTNATMNNILAQNTPAKEAISNIINNKISHKNVENTFKKTLKEIEDTERLKDLNDLLRTKLKEYEASDNSKLKLFEIGVVSSEIRKHTFPDDISERCPYEFDNIESFKQIQNGDLPNEYGQKVNKDLLKYANKMNTVVNEMLTDKSISKKALNIALNTSAKAKDVDAVFKNIENRMSGLNDADTLRVFKTYYEKAKPYINREKEEKQAVNIIGMIKVAEITYSRLHKDKELPYHFDLKRADPYTLDPALNKDSIVKESDFIEELDKLANIKIEEDKKPYIKTWGSGDKNYLKLLTTNNNRPLNKGPYER